MKIWTLLFFIFSFALHAEETLRVARVSGSVKYAGKAVKADDKLAGGGLLETGAADTDYVDLAFSDGHQLRVKKKAKLKLETLHPVKTNSFELLAGQVYGHFVEKSNASRITIKTKSAVAGVRGTQYLIEEDPEKGTYVCVCKGSVNVEGVSEKGERTVNAGQDLWIKPGKPLGQPKDSPDMSTATKDVFKSMGF